MKQVTSFLSLVVLLAAIFAPTSSVAKKHGHRHHHRRSSSSSSRSSRTYQLTKGDPEESRGWRKTFRREHQLFRTALVSDLEDVELPAGVNDGEPWRDKANRKFWEPIPCKAAGFDIEVVKTVFESEGGNRVFKVWCHRHKQHFAMKFFGSSQDLQAETNFYSHARHPYLLRPHCFLHGQQVKGYGLEKSQGGLVLDWFDGISALDYAKKSGTRHVDLVGVAAKMFHTLTYIHYIGFVHADLKLDNVLVDAASKDVRIIDFGFAIRLPYYVTKRGNPNIVAPEIAGLTDGPVHEGIDWWAYGSCLATLFGYQHLPYYRRIDIRKGTEEKYVAFRIHKKGRVFTVEAVPGAFPEELRRILYWCWSLDPDARQFNTVQSLLLLKKQPLFKDVKWAN